MSEHIEKVQRQEQTDGDGSAKKDNKQEQPPEQVFMAFLLCFALETC